MAKWGEGDPRWIVEERADAHNVNNWHWRESDATQWSKNKFKELLDGMLIGDESVGSCTLSNIVCEGEASVSNRKNKIICFYEWKISAKWKGGVKNDATVYKGELIIENMSEEYEPDEVDVEIKINKENKENTTITALMKTFGVVLVREKLQAYLDQLRTNYGTQLILPPKDAKVDSRTAVSTMKNSTNLIKKEMNNLAMNDKKTDKTNAGIKITTKKLTMSETFMTTVDELYLTLTLKDRISAWSRSEVKSDVDVGTVLTLFDKNVEAEFTELVRDKKLVMKWRMKSWMAGHYSTVTLDLEQTVDGAKVSLQQSGIPENSVEATTNGWRRYYWDAIKMTFGYGSRIM
uniref:activator of 90 kDa heat shock protein ATPase homolog 1-like n=1 Tax=Styela clava TaxID=7725 RepID=UPI00193AC44E|nr:activator of 90 kDa heat shock protein ATPase homolog 1-like [Styela clava]